MILDMLFIALCAASFAGGWWCRAKFGSAAAMIDAGASKLKGVASKADAAAPAPAATRKPDEF